MRGHVLGGPLFGSGDFGFLCLASSRHLGEEAGLSRRAVCLAAEFLWDSTRQAFDSRLALFGNWCAGFPCFPTLASLSQVAVASVRSFCSALAFCLEGFPVG